MRLPEIAADQNRDGSWLVDDIGQHPGRLPSGPVVVETDEVAAHVRCKVVQHCKDRNSRRCQRLHCAPDQGVVDRRGPDDIRRACHFAQQVRVFRRILGFGVADDHCSAQVVDVLDFGPESVRQVAIKLLVLLRQHEPERGTWGVTVQPVPDHRSGMIVECDRGLEDSSCVFLANLSPPRKDTVHRCNADTGTRCDVGHCGAFHTVRHGWKSIPKRQNLESF